MSKPLSMQSGTGRLAEIEGKPIIVVIDTAISDGGAGYHPGCIAIDKTNAVVYVNEGSVTSCDFNAVSVP